MIQKLYKKSNLKGKITTVSKRENLTWTIVFDKSKRKVSLEQLLKTFILTFKTLVSRVKTHQHNPEQNYKCILRER